MGRAALLLVAFALTPPTCLKARGENPAPSAAPEPPLPSATLTAPPRWLPPEATASAPVPSAPAVSPELTKARAAFEAKDYKKVKAILDKRVHGGKASEAEVTLLAQACTVLKDKPCLEMLAQVVGDAPLAAP